MTPHSFDIGTAKQWVGDERMREVESKARLDAEADTYSPPNEQADTYAGQVACQMLDTVYLNAYHNRKLRLERMAQRAQAKPAQEAT